MRPLASVIIPSHNEANVIDRLLTPLAEMAESGELEIHVVCNGCSDRTAAIAGTFAGVKVYELKEASKTAALNLGDQKADGVFPRLYIDADIVVDVQSLRKVIAALDEGPALAAAPGLRVILDGRPLLVRDYYNIFIRLPWTTEALVGSGFYGVSREGRSRFTEFPDISNDDLFFRSLFEDHERLSVPDAEFTIEAPRTTRALIRAKARVHLGTLQFIALNRERQYLDRIDAPAKPARAGVGQRGAAHLASWATSPTWGFALHPSLWRPLLNHSGIRLAATIVAHWPRPGNRELGWAQDRTTRDIKKPHTHTQQSRRQATR